MTRFYAGLDLGQASDYTARVVLERKEPPQVRPEHVWTFSGASGPVHRVLDDAGAFSPLAPQTPPPRYEVRHIERFALGTTYPHLVNYTYRLLQREPLKNATALVVDGTGVGRPVVDMFAQRMQLHPIVITGGTTANRSADGYDHVPKRDLIASVQTLLQQGRLRFASSLPGVELLVHELQNYRVKISDAGHDSYNAREGQHDDLVLALALACWYADRYAMPQILF